MVTSTGYGARTQTQTREHCCLPQWAPPTTEGADSRFPCTRTISHPKYSSTPILPLLELLGGDEASSKVGVSHSLGLPPGGVILAHHLQDLPPLEGQACLLAGDGTVLSRVIVEEGTHEYLDGKGCSEGALLDKGTSCVMTAATTVRKHERP